MNETLHERAAYEMALSQFQAQGITDYLDGEVEALADQLLYLAEAYPGGALEAQLNGWSEPEFTF